MHNVIEDIQIQTLLHFAQQRVSVSTVHIMAVAVLNDLKYETLLKDSHALTAELDRYAS